MSGKSGQVLTSSFYDDCENIILYNGYPVFVVNQDEIFKDGETYVSLSSFEDASNRLGLSVDVLKDLTRLANVKLLSKRSSGEFETLNINPLRSCVLQHTSAFNVITDIDASVEFGDANNYGVFILRISYKANGEFVQGQFSFHIE